VSLSPAGGIKKRGDGEDVLQRSAQPIARPSHALKPRVLIELFRLPTLLTLRAAALLELRKLSTEGAWRSLPVPLGRWLAEPPTPVPLITLAAQESRSESANRNLFCIERKEVVERIAGEEAEEGGRVPRAYGREMTGFAESVSILVVGMGFRVTLPMRRLRPLLPATPP